ncbi:MAG: hypothetical protein MR729_07030 [Dorea sp.]|nr:hypothetical protein [Dorea sp.]
MNDHFNKLTAELDLPDVKVVNRHLAGYILVLDTVPSHKMRTCPFCKLSQIKQLNRFTRTFWDASPIGEGEIIQIQHTFHRYQCRNQQCGHVFSDPLSFARPRSQVTYRFERFVFNYTLLNNASLSNIAALTDNALTRQAIRKIFYRYLDENVEKDPLFLDKYYQKNYDDLILSYTWSRLFRTGTCNTSSTDINFRLFPMQFNQPGKP